MFDLTGRPSGRRWPGILAAVLTVVATGASIPGQSAREEAAARTKAEIAAELARLKSKDPQERRTAANQLGHLRATQAIRPLCDLLATESDDEVRYFAMGALADIGASEAIPRIRPFLQARSEALRLAAAAALLELEDDAEETLDGVVKLLDAETEHARSVAGLLVAIHRIERAVPALVRRLDAPDLTTRFWAVSALAAIGSKQCLPALKKLHAGLAGAGDSGTTELRDAVEGALIALDPEGQRKRIAEWLRADDPAKRVAAADVLASQGDRAAIPVLLEAGCFEKLNLFSDPALCKRLAQTPLRKAWLRTWTVAEILEHLRKTLKIEIVVSPSITADLENARFGANLPMLGARPSAEAILGALKGWFVGGLALEGLDWIAEGGKLRIVPREESRAYWAEFVKTRK